MRFLCHGIILVNLIIHSVFGQGVNLTGHVKDAANGNPLAGANVIIVGTSIGTAADGDGKYKIPNLKVGDYLVKAAYIGYIEAMDSINITGEKDIELNFNLGYTTIEGKEVVVTAQAKGQMDAINKQLNAKSIVNIVSSDRIQELPDANAAESVARVPGVTIKREGGEGNKVIIRGLSPKYNSITVDGTKLASTDPDDRSTDLSMISQYMLDGIEVTKAGTPDLDADVLGGTVDFKLKRAEPGLHANIITQGMYNGLEDSYNDRKLVLDMGNRFWNDRIGVLGQVDYENRNRSANELGASYDNPGAVLDSIIPVVLTNLNLSDVSRLNDRKNSLFVLDVNIPNGNISYSNLNSSISKDITRHSQSYAMGFNTRRLSSGTGTNTINVVTETFKYRQTFFSKLHLDAFSSWSLSSNKLNYYSFNFLEPFAFTQSAYNKNINQIQEIAKHDTNAIGLDNYSYDRISSRETERTYGLNVKYDFRISSQISGSIKIGNKFRKKSRAYDKNYEYAPVAAAAGLRGPRDSLIANFPRISEYVPLGTRTMQYWPFIDPDYNPDNFLDGRFLMGPGADLDFMLEIFKYFRKNFNRYSPGASTIDEYIMHRLHETNSILYDYSGNEDYAASYAMIDLAIGSKINIITGGRLEKNSTTYNSWRAWKTPLPHWVFTGDPYTEDRENEFWLPAFFLHYKPFQWLNIRFAKTNTITRPNYTDIIPLYHVDGTGRTIDHRNPYLRPGKSENIDFNVSINQNHLGLFSVGYFKKNIEDLIYSSGRRYIEDTEKYGVPPETEKYAIENYTANNPNEVILEGFEIDYQTRFWYLPSFLSGLVFNANYTLTDSEVKYPRTIIDIAIDWGPPLTTVTTNIDTFYIDRLIDQPDEIINLSLGYDYKGFSGRLSMLYKSNTFTRADFWPELRESTNYYRRYDLSIKQDLLLEGLEIYVNVSNLTNAKDVTLVRGGNYPSSEQHYGKTIDLGFRYSF